MRTKYRALTAAAVILGFLACGDTPVPSNRDPKERQPNPITKKTVKITAFSSSVPYEVFVVARNANDPDNASQRDIWDEVVAQGRYEQTLDYDSGLRIEIRVEVKPGKIGANVWCLIEDGENINRDEPAARGGGNTYRANCELVTNR